MPLHLAFTHDEETGCFGAPALIRRAAGGAGAAGDGDHRRADLDAGRQPAEGLSFFRTRVTGREGHSSAPERGVNAIAAAAEIIARNRPAAAEARVRARPDSGFDPPHTTMSVGTISGGTAVNIIARDCTFEWDLRNLPHDDAAALKSRIDRFVADDAAAAHARGLSAGGGRDRDRRRGAAAGAGAGFAGRGIGAASDRRQHDDGRLVRDRGRAVISRPASRRSSAAPARSTVAHKPDEYITRAELAAGQAFLDRLLDWASRPG